MSSSNDQLQLLKRNSTAKITLALRKYGPMPRVQLAKTTGLSIACVGKVVNELILGGELTEVGSVTGQRGRPKAYVDINPAGAPAAGVLIGAGSIQVVLVNRRGEITARETVLYRPDDGLPEHVIDTVVDAIRKCTLVAGEKAEKLTGVGVSVAGAVDSLIGVIHILANRRGWQDVPIVRMLEQRLGVPVYADNNARAAALSAQWFDEKSYDGGAVYLYIGEGIGGAYVDDRGLMRGLHNVAGYFGHMTVEPDGPMCVCGNRGCLVTLASDIAFIRGIWPDKVNSAADLTFTERASLVKEGIEKARYGDLMAARSLTAVTRYIGIGVANIIAAFDPHVVHIYGTMTDIATDHVVDLIRREAMQRIWPEARGVEIKALVDYEEFLLRGATGLVLSQPYKELREQVHEVSAAHGGSQRFDPQWLRLNEEVMISG